MQHKALPNLAIREEDRAFEQFVSRFNDCEAHLLRYNEQVCALKEKLGEIMQLYR
jgi:hypothetical protein